MYPTTRAYTFCSSTYEIFLRTDYTIGHKARFNRFQKLYHIQTVFSDHCSIKLKINNKKYNYDREYFNSEANNWLGKILYRKIQLLDGRSNDRIRQSPFSIINEIWT